jgi:hypothetical protein
MEIVVRYRKRPRLNRAIKYSCMRVPISEKGCWKILITGNIPSWVDRITRGHRNLNTISCVRGYEMKFTAKLSS